MRKATFAVVVPAYNEEKVIGRSLQSLLRCIKAENIFVVSDGSSDKTVKIARAFTKNVLNLRRNRGKAGALKELLKKYAITDRYKYVFFFDADTEIGQYFLPEVKKVIQQKSPACVVGTVTSSKNRVISAFRVFEYGFSHKFFKNAQNAMGTIVIAPGCASVYRSDVLAKLNFNGRTLTEDLDFTIQIQQNRYGQVVYCPRARVFTQDPMGFKDFWKQITRWNTGFWQNFFMHRLYRPNRTLHLEVLLLMSDFVLWIGLLFFAALQPLYFLTLYATSLVILTIIACATIIAERQYWALPYVPIFNFFQVINTISFIYSFFRAVFGSKKRLSWQKVTRYAN
jgi:cellulose synthase/poly-beta-1,6-N-acetylglucosamine synthase-like glycosyltransferase